MADYAVIQAGGTQVRVSEGSTVNLEGEQGAPGTEIVLGKVLMLASGGDVKVGRPFVDGASVVAEVVTHGRGKKIRISRFKRKKGYQRTMGYRSHFTTVRIKSIAG